MAKQPWDEKRLGLVTEITGSSILVHIDEGINNLTKKLGEKTYYIGQIGSYVLIPVGKYFVIGVVAEFRKVDVDRKGTASSRYVMTVTPTGTMKDGRYEPGVSILPTADSVVYLLEDKDLKVAFSAFQKFDFSIGKLSQFEDQRAFIDPNRFFSKHIAVLGSSGAGKSCTVASILRKVVQLPFANVLLIDIHSEYKRAFSDGAQHFDLVQLELPYWLMNFEEMMEMFIDRNDENASLHVSMLQDLITASKKSANPRLAQVITVDSPVYFDLNEVRAKIQFLDSEKTTGPSGTKEGPYTGKLSRLLVRLNAKLNDPRYAFMFRPQICLDTDSAKPVMMMLFGLTGKVRITIMDVSGIPFDIVRTVVALVGRLAFDFNFWNPNHSELPILLVFEEAHNYLSSTGEGTSAARRVVERIAKEGRKYGVSCMIVSQRPSEISETILSQCNNFVLLRILNPVDQAYIRRLVPDTFSGMEGVVPLLRQGEALIVGDAMPMPMRVQIDMPEPAPDSFDVKFFDKWKQRLKQTDADDVMERWWTQQRSR
jgi:hypothetical protein